MVTDGRWHRLAVTVGTGGTDIYLDGEHLNGGDSSKFFSAVGELDKMIIGGVVTDTGISRQWNGSIGTVEIFDGILTSEQAIAATQPPAIPVATWRIDNELTEANAIAMIDTPGGVIVAKDYLPGDFKASWAVGASFTFPQRLHKDDKTVFRSTSIAESLDFGIWRTETKIKDDEDEGTDEADDTETDDDTESDIDSTDTDDDGTDDDTDTDTDDEDKTDADSTDSDDDGTDDADEDKTDADCTDDDTETDNDTETVDDKTKIKIKHWIGLRLCTPDGESWTLKTRAERYRGKDVSVVAVLSPHYSYLVINGKVEDRNKTAIPDLSWMGNPFDTTIGTKDPASTLGTHVKSVAIWKGIVPSRHLAKSLTLTGNIAR